MKNKPFYHCEFAFDHAIRATMVSYVTKNKIFVCLLSTLHTNKAIGTDEKKGPEIIHYYNSTKCGVEIMDEMVGTYCCKRKVNRWPVAV